MRVGGRSLSRIFDALVQPHHYRGLYNALGVYDNPAVRIMQYIRRTGRYPGVISVRTPTGPISINLYSPDDLVTVNEIFCRQDYQTDGLLRCVVDIGSNIGISALYFLTRNKTSKCYLYEPVPANVDRLRENLHGFERFEISRCAIADFAGAADFGIEPSGRYGGLQVGGNSTIRVEVKEINGELRRILAREERIDVVKIDTEGNEISTVLAIDAELMKRIGRIYMEAAPDAPVFKRRFPGFSFAQRGSICILTNLTQGRSSIQAGA